MDFQVIKVAKTESLQRLPLPVETLNRSNSGSAAELVRTSQPRAVYEQSTFSAVCKMASGLSTRFLPRSVLTKSADVLPGEDTSACLSSE